MDKLAKEFQMGFQEGWNAFWSPFTGLYRAITSTWNRHVPIEHGHGANHRHA